MVFFGLYSAGILGLVVPSAFGLQSATFLWDQNQEPDVAGYILYYGDAPSHYTNSIDVGNVTRTTLSNLVEGATYYLTVTVFDTSGFESGPSSNEVSYNVPQVMSGPVDPLIVWANPARSSPWRPCARAMCAAPRS